MATIFGTSYHDDGTWQLIGWAPSPIPVPVLWEFGALVGTDAADTIKGYQGNDHLHGNGGNDRLYGGANNDLLTGGQGNDYLHGGTGIDTMYGGFGNDTFVVMDAGDQIFEYAGQGIDTVHSYINHTLAANVENLVLLEGGAYAEYGDSSVTFAAPTRGTGNELNNRIEGNSQGNTLSGLNGQDTILGGGGADFILGGIGDDLLYGGDAADVLDGGDGNDSLRGDADNDLLIGANGNDFLDGGTGVDSMFGGAGNDFYTVDHPNDLVSESPDSGIDLISASVSFTLPNHVENLNLAGISNINGTGNSGNNVITGNGGDNTLVGNAGNDTLNGYEGFTDEYDTLTGGTGSDRFVLGDAEIGAYYLGNGYAIITDFDPYTPIGLPVPLIDLEYDIIQVKGQLSAYTLGQSNVVGGAALDTVISRGSDIIGIVQDTTNVSLSRDFIVV